jgi:hypothetical protein
MRLSHKAAVFLTCFACAVSAFPGVGACAEPEARVVYIAPDIGTYVYAISLWDNETRFPIFMREDRFLDVFLKGYPGAELKRLEHKKVGAVDKALVYRALYAAWGPETLDDAPSRVSRDDLKARLNALGVVPEGIVITSLDDDEFAAGLALAAGHMQPLAFHRSRLKRSLHEGVSKNSAPEVTKESLRKQFLEAVESWGYPYKGLGEGIDYITLALNMRHTYRVDSGTSPTKSPYGFSMTDAIGRLTASGLVEVETPGGPKKGEPSVYAYCGMLIEGAPQMALYQAMASLFAETPRALYYHLWGKKLDALAGVKGYQVLRTSVYTINRDMRKPPIANREQWERLTGSGHRFGFIHVASAGGTREWSGRHVEDVPEGQPCAVYFAQSGSAGNPARGDTIAGRWLLNGAYVYYGAAAEPYAPSFSPAQTVAQTLVAGGTYGKAFQRKDTLPEPFRRPWKLVYIGDPMARPRFVEDPDEPEWSRTWRQAVAHLRQANYRKAVTLMEPLVGQVPAGRADELWRDLVRAYELTIGIGTLDVPDPDRFFPPEFIDGWMLPADVAEHRPELGWRARLHLRLVKDGDLLDLLASRLKLEDLSDALKSRLEDEIEALEASVTFAKMWLVLGPLEWPEPGRLPTDFPDEVPGTGKPLPGLEGPIRWGPRVVNAKTLLLELDAPRSQADALYLAVTFAQVGGRTTCKARLELTGSAANAEPAPVVWVNRELVESEADSGFRHITLRPGLNEIVVRLGAARDVRGSITLGMSLTGPDGKRSRAFSYVDLIKLLRGRDAPPRGQ